VQQELDRLRIEIEKLRGVGERLVLAADADRRTFERDLHDGVQQHLVALATTLQLARLAADADPMAVETLLDELGRDVRQALDEPALLA
jgi:signal transduction histidine kinase